MINPPLTIYKSDRSGMLRIKRSVPRICPRASPCTARPRSRSLPRGEKEVDGVVGPGTMLSLGCYPIGNPQKRRKKHMSGFFLL